MRTPTRRCHVNAVMSAKQDVFTTGVCFSSSNSTLLPTDGCTSHSQLSSYSGLQHITEVEDSNSQSYDNWTWSGSRFNTAAVRNTSSQSTSGSFLSSQTGSRHIQRETQNTCRESSPKLKFSLPSLSRLYVYRRFPCNKKIWLVYMMFFLQGIGEYSSLIFLFFALDAYPSFNPPHTVAAYLLVRCVTFTAYPVMGFLADTFFGRYQVIKASLYISLLGAMTLAIGFSMAYIDPWLQHSEVNEYERFNFQGHWPNRTVIFLTIVYTVMLIGFTGIQVNLIPFGVDQLDEASSGELSSYFHWYFWWFNAGALVGVAIVPYIYQNYSLGLFFLLLAMCFTGEILIIVLYRDTEFIIQSHIGNPLRLVYQVLKSSFRAKKPAFKSAFDVGRPPPCRMDLAMNINGGKFTVEQVEDVKTFFRILVILSSLFGYFAVSSQLLTTYILEAVRMTVPYGTVDDCTASFQSSITTHQIECQLWKIPPSLWIVITNFVPTLILIPLVDRILYVCFRFSMLKRITVGEVFLFLSIAVAIGVEVARQRLLWSDFNNKNSTIVINAIPFHTESTTTLHIASPLSIFFVAPQYFLFAFAEIFCNITAVEFIYAQSPGAMKGLLLGLLFLTNGLAMGLASALIFFQSFAPQFEFTSFFGNSKVYFKDVFKCLIEHRDNVHQCVDSPLFSYIFLAVVVLFSAAVFMRAACKYKFRKRDLEPYNPLLIT